MADIGSFWLKAYLLVSPIEHIGTCFLINMHSILLFMSYMSEAVDNILPYYFEPTLAR